MHHLKVKKALEHLVIDIEKLLHQQKVVGHIGHGDVLMMKIGILIKEMHGH